MQNSIQKINHPKFGSLRAVVLNGAIYFVGKDAAERLEYNDTSQAVRVHVQPQDKIVFRPVNLTGQFENVDGVKIPHNAILINESGLWSLVLNSKMPQAQEFQHWITSEVIPQIVRTGKYISPGVASPKAAELLEDFTNREKVEILLKLLNFPNLPNNLRNSMIRHIDLILSPDTSEFWENLMAQNAE